MATPDEWNSLFGIDHQFDLEQRFVRGTGVAATAT
jgi:hypothetical protein